MAFNAGYKTRVLLGDFSLSPKLASISVPTAVEARECTTYGDNGSRKFVPGFSSGSVQGAGFIDADTLTDANSWTTNTPLTVGYEGFTAGNKVTMLDAVKATFTVGSQVAGVSSFDLSATADGFTDFGVSLHDLEAETADADESSVDNAASTANGGVGHLHVTAFSGFSQAVLKIQHSTDNAAWSDLITFTTVAGVTGERSTVTGTVNRYVRASLDVTGTGSITYQLSFARR